MKRILLILLTALTLSSCADAQGAQRVLEGAGYTKIEITGYQFFGCGNEEVHTGFKAEGPTGHPVTGVVCAGLIGKNSTIRLD